jgi:hypothetical protein
VTATTYRLTSRLRLFAVTCEARLLRRLADFSCCGFLCRNGDAEILEEMLRLRMFAIAAGYEDADDCG